MQLANGTSFVSLRQALRVIRSPKASVRPGRVVYKFSKLKEDPVVASRPLDNLADVVVGIDIDQLLYNASNSSACF